MRMTVLAHPGAKTERVAMLADDTLAVWVRARPVEGQANGAIERALANALGLKARHVKIVGGRENRRKIVEIDVSGAELIKERLRSSS